MPERYTSRLALRLDEPVDVDRVVQGAIDAGDIDRTGRAPGDAAEAQEVHWGGRMQKGVVRRTTDDEDRPLLRAEVYIGGDGLERGMQRQAQLLQALARQVDDERITGVVDLSARVERDRAWMNRLAIGAVDVQDVITLVHVGEGTYWVHTHGAARLDVPDLELYGLARSQLEAAGQAIRHVHDQLLRRGLDAELTLPGGESVYLVPVLEAWQELPMDWPGIGRAGQERGPGLAGPRATLSILHPPRLGRYATDLEGVIEALGEG